MSATLDGLQALLTSQHQETQRRFDGLEDKVVIIRTESLPALDKRVTIVEGNQQSKAKIAVAILSLIGTGFVAAVGAGC